jgi:hypothetical protein
MVILNDGKLIFFTEQEKQLIRSSRDNSEGDAIESGNPSIEAVVKHCAYSTLMSIPKVREIVQDFFDCEIIESETGTFSYTEQGLKAALMNLGYSRNPNFKLTGFPMIEALDHPLIIGWMKVVPGLEQAIESGKVIGIGLLSNGYRVTVSEAASEELVRSMKYIGIEVVQDGE